jgi:hypothetical protein
MPGYDDHVRAGVRFYGAFVVTAVVYWRTGLSIALCFVLALIGASFPDTDIKSKPQLLFYRTLFVVDAGLIALYYARGAVIYLQGAALLGLGAMGPLLGKHRGWTHSRLAMVAVPSPLVLVPMLVENAVVWPGLPYYIAAMLGYASHLYMDGILFRR